MLCILCILDVTHELIDPNTGQSCQNPLIVNKRFQTNFSDHIKKLSNLQTATTNVNGFLQVIAIQWILFTYASQQVVRVQTILFFLHQQLIFLRKKVKYY